MNRLDGEDKDYGYIFDYKELLRDYTSGAFDGDDKEDVAGLLENRLEKARERLEDARDTLGSSVSKWF